MKNEVSIVFKTILKQTLTTATAFTLSQATVFEELSPFAVGYIAAIDKTYAPAALLGAAAGYIVSKENATAIRYIAAIIITSLLANTLNKLWSAKYSKVFVVSSAFFATFTTGLALCLSETITGTIILLFLSESVVAACCAYFMKRAFSLHWGKNVFSYLNTQDTVCLLFSFGLLLLSLDWLSIGSFSPVRIIASFAIILAARYGKEAGGAIAGIAAGITLGIPENVRFLMGAYPLGGLLAGVFGIFGRLPAALAFIVSKGLIALLSGSLEDAFSTLIEAVIASCILLLLPKKLCNEIETAFSPRCGVPVVDGIKNVLNIKMRTASDTVFDVSKSVKAVGNALLKMSVPDINIIYTQVQDKICKTCDRRSFCWEYNYNGTMNVFNDIISTLKKGEMISKYNIPVHFAEGCKRSEVLSDTFNNLFREYAVKNSVEGKVSAVRAVAADQYAVLSLILDDLSQELSKDFSLDNDTAEISKNVFENFGIPVTNILSVIDSSGHLLIQADSLPPKSAVNKTELTKDLSQKLGVLLEFPLIEESVNGTNIIKFYEKPPLKVIVDSSQYTSEKQSLSGDSFQTFYDGLGNYIIVLSDGMGTGNRAAVDGTMAAGLASKLIAAGFGPDCTLKIVNSALLVKSREESLSTLDIVKINLYTGQTTFFKAGAEASFLRKRGKILKVEKSSLPLGIISDVEFEKITVNLSAGDIITVLSDGAAECPLNDLKSELKAAVSAGISGFASTIAKKAVMACKNTKVDDITVIAASIERN